MEAWKDELEHFSRERKGIILFTVLDRSRKGIVRNRNSREPKQKIATSISIALDHVSSLRPSLLPKTTVKVVF